MAAMTSPDMRVLEGTGLALPAARHFRLRVEDDALVLHRPGVAPQQVTTVASADGIVWLSPEESRRLLLTPYRRLLARSRRADAETRGGAVVVLERGRPVLALPLGPLTAAAGDPAHLRKLSGAPRLARALGLVLERGQADGLDAAAVRQVAVHPRRGSAVLAPAVAAGGVLATVLGLLSWPILGDPSRSGDVEAALALVAVVALAPAIALMVRARRRFLRLVSTPPEPAARTVFRLPGERRNGLHGQLQVGAEDVVVVDTAGTEFWLPGPERGGVTRCEVAEDLLVWTNADGEPVGPPLRTGDVAPTAEHRRELGQACAPAGIELVDSTPMPLTLPAGLPHVLVYEGNWKHPAASLSWQTGSVGILGLTAATTATLVVAPGAVAAAVNTPGWGWLAFLGWLACAAGRLWTSVAHRRWRRNIIKHQGAP